MIKNTRMITCLRCCCYKFYWVMFKMQTKVTIVTCVSVISDLWHITNSTVKTYHCVTCHQNLQSFFCRWRNCEWAYWKFSKFTGHCGTCWNPNTWEAEARWLQVQDQPGMLGDFTTSQSYTASPCLNTKGLKCDSVVECLLSSCRALGWVWTV